MTSRKALILLMLLLFWAVSLRHLAVVPSVYEDEPWQASTGWKIATEGVFGSDLFAGFYGMEQHYFGFMPLHPILLAGIFRLGGQVAPLIVIYGEILLDVSREPDW